MAKHLDVVATAEKCSVRAQIPVSAAPEAVNVPVLMRVSVSETDETGAALSGVGGTVVTVPVPVSADAIVAAAKAAGIHLPKPRSSSKKGQS